MHLRLGLDLQVLLQHLADHTHQAVAVRLGQVGPLALVQWAGRRGGLYCSAMGEHPLEVIGLPLFWRQRQPIAVNSPD
jgi:hypothetical protein